MPSKSEYSSRSLTILSTSSRVHWGFRTFLGLLDLSFRAFEVSGVELLLPPVVCTPSYPIPPTGDGHGVGTEQSRGFQGFSLLRESMDLSELGNGTPCGEAQKVQDLQNMPEESLSPLCYSSCRCRAFLLLRFSTLSEDTGLSPFCLPYLPQISVNLSRPIDSSASFSV